MAHRLTRPSRTSSTAAARPFGRAAGIALLVAGLLLIGAGVRSEPARLTVHSHGFVNADRPSINAHNSPAVAVDPSRPSVVAAADRIDSPQYSCSLSISTTAGATWRPVPFTLAPDAPNCFWPDVAFVDGGQLLVLYTATGGRYSHPVGTWIQRFDGEQPAGPPVKVAGSEAFHAHFAVSGRTVLVAWVQLPPSIVERPLGFEPGTNPLMVARSTDGGATFSPPVRLSGNERVAHPSVVFGRDGTAFVGALDYGDDLFNYEGRHEGLGGPPPDARWRVVGWRSADAGATFGPLTVVADGVVVPQRVVIDLAPGPSFAADPSSSRMYATWDAGTGSGRDVFLARSPDGGSSWEPPGRVGPRPQGQFLPAVDVAPDGRVDMVFYDRSDDPQDVQGRAMVATSWDGGRTFTTRAASEDAFDTRIGRASLSGIPELGNQLAVASVGEEFLAFWADTSRGTIDSGVQDLAVATVTPRTAGGRSWPLLVLGVAVAGAAVLILRRRPSAG